MGIYMFGLDYRQADLDTRAVFSMTKKERQEYMESLAAKDGENIIDGIIVLSTCNRTEVWMSSDADCAVLAFEKLCRAKGVPQADVRSRFIFRTERDAAEHLFRTACGLNSQIQGEDQIVSQVVEALDFSRGLQLSDSVLEVLFRKGITASKKVKTEVVFPKGNSSIVNAALELLKAQGYSVSGKRCMVIGNGEMGRLTANALLTEGAMVSMTLRQYRHGMPDMPKGVTVIDYGKRDMYLSECDFVFSATASPHCTITRSMTEASKQDRLRIFVDLAVPRDIESSVSETENVLLFDVDDFKHLEQSDALRNARGRAELILDELLEEFFQWQTYRDIIPRINCIKNEAAMDIQQRSGKFMAQIDLSPEDRALLQSSVNRAACNVINKVMFSLRDSLSREAFCECLEGLERLYEE